MHRPKVTGGPNLISANASVFPANTIYACHATNACTCPNNFTPERECLSYNASLPAGIVAAGAVGLATYAPTSGAGVVDTYATKFTSVPSAINPD